MKSIKLYGDEEGALRCIPEAERLLYLLKAGNIQNLKSVWHNRYLPDGSFVQISSIFGNDTIVITSPATLEELEEVIVTAKFFISGDGFRAAFNIDGSTFTPIDATINCSRLYAIAAATPPRGSIAIVSSADFGEHRNTCQYDSYSFDSVTYQGYYYWIGLSQYYGISTGGGTVYGSRCAFIPPSTVKIWGNPGTGTPRLACAGRRNYKVDDDGNLIQWDEEIWRAGVRADNSVIWDFKYTDSGGTHTDSDIWETFNIGTSSSGGGDCTADRAYLGCDSCWYENSSDIQSITPIATLGDRKHLYSKNHSVITNRRDYWCDPDGKVPEYGDNVPWSELQSTTSSGASYLYLGDDLYHEGNSTYEEVDYEAGWRLGTVAGVHENTYNDNWQYNSAFIQDYDNINGTDNYILFLSELDFESSNSQTGPVADDGRIWWTASISESYSYFLRYTFNGAEQSISLGSFASDFNSSTYYPGIGGPAAFETTRTNEYTGAAVYGASCYISDDHMYFTYSTRTPTTEDQQPGLTDWAKVKQVVGVIDRATGAVTTKEYYPIDAYAVPTVTAVEAPGEGSLEYMSGALPPTPGRNYTFRVCAMNPCSRTGFGVSNTVTLSVANSGIRLTWSAVSDATHYMIGYLISGRTRVFACVTGTEFLLSSMDTYWIELGNCVLDISLGTHLLPAVGYDVSLA